MGEEPSVQGHVVLSSSYHYNGPRSYYSGGAGLVSTIDDYHRFARLLLNRGELEGSTLLEADTVDMMTRNQIGDFECLYGDKFGLGVAVQTKPGNIGPPGSFGWGGYFHTRFSVHPEKNLIILFMSQRPPSEGLAVQGDFVSAVYNSISEQEVPGT